MSDKLVFLGHDEPHSAADFAAVRAQASFVRKAEAEASWPAGVHLDLMTTTDIGTADQMNSSGAVSTYVLRQHTVFGSYTINNLFGLLHNYALRFNCIVREGIVRCSRIWQ